MITVEVLLNDTLLGGVGGEIREVVLVCTEEEFTSLVTMVKMALTGRGSSIFISEGGTLIDVRFIVSLSVIDSFELDEEEDGGGGEELDPTQEESGSNSEKDEMKTWN